MKTVVISFCDLVISEINSVLKKKNIDIIDENYDCLYPNEIINKFGKNIRVIFVTRKITDVINLIKNKEKLENGINILKQHYKNLKSDFVNYHNLFENDTLNFEKLFDSYKNINNFSVLFIKYENLFINDNNHTFDMLNDFLNSNITQDDFYNNCKRFTSEKMMLDKIEISQINKIFSSLDNKISKYNTQFITHPLILIDKIELLKYNSHYRFGDVIFQSGFYWKTSISYILKNDEFKSTILREYVEKYKHKCDFQLLLKIIDNKIKEKKYILPQKNELVIHLRLGDVIVHDWFLKKNYREIILDNIKKYNISKVTFCTAFHYGNYTERNLWIYNDEKHQQNKIKLTEKLNSLLDIPNIYIDLKSSKNPDFDLMYMVKSYHFIPDVGGFSNLVSILKYIDKK